MFPLINDNCMIINTYLGNGASHEASVLTVKPPVPLGIVRTGAEVNLFFNSTTTLTPEQLTAEIQRTVKGLLGYGAKMPKELMLFVKNMVFLDGAIATLAPNLDIFAEIAHIATYFATRHGQQISEEVGVDEQSWQLDMGGVRAMYGVDDTTDALTHRELQQRREVIAARLSSRERPTLRSQVAKRARTAVDRRRSPR